MRIMIADDDAAIRESMERVLQVEGYDISAVANGLAVLDGSAQPPLVSTGKAWATPGVRLTTSSTRS